MDIVLRTFNSVQCFVQPQVVFEIIFSPLADTVTVLTGDMIITHQKGLEIIDSKPLSEAVCLFPHTPHRLSSVPSANRNLVSSSSHQGNDIYLGAVRLRKANLDIIKLCSLKLETKVINF